MERSQRYNRIWYQRAEPLKQGWDIGWYFQEPGTDHLKGPFDSEGAAVDAFQHYWGAIEKWDKKEGDITWELPLREAAKEAARKAFQDIDWDKAKIPDKSLTPWQPGPWICDVCGTGNVSARRNCNWCGRPRTK